MKLHQALIDACEGHLRGRNLILAPACLFLFGLPTVPIRDGSGLSLEQIIHDVTTPLLRQNNLTLKSTSKNLYESLATHFHLLVPSSEFEAQFKCLTRSNSCAKCTATRGCHYHNYMPPEKIGMCELYKSLQMTQNMGAFSSLRHKCDPYDGDGDNPILSVSDPLYDMPLCTLEESRLSKAIYQSPPSLIESANPIGQSNNCDQAAKWGFDYERVETPNQYEFTNLLASVGIRLPLLPSTPPVDPEVVIAEGLSKAAWVVIASAVFLALTLLSGGGYCYYYYIYKARFMDPTLVAEGSSS